MGLRHPVPKATELRVRFPGYTISRFHHRYIQAHSHTLACCTTTRTPWWKNCVCSSAYTCACACMYACLCVDIYVSTCLRNCLMCVCVCVCVYWPALNSSRKFSLSARVRVCERERVCVCVRAHVCMNVLKHQLATQFTTQFTTHKYYRATYWQILPRMQKFSKFCAPLNLLY